MPNACLRHGISYLEVSIICLEDREHMALHHLLSSIWVVGDTTERVRVQVNLRRTAVMWIKVDDFWVDKSVDQQSWQKPTVESDTSQDGLSFASHCERADYPMRRIYLTRAS